MAINHHLLRCLALWVVVMFTSTVQLHAATTRVLAGDVNGDGIVSVTDVMLMVRYIQGNNMTDVPFSFAAADVNRDEDITVTDVMIVVKIVLGARFDDPDNPYLIIDEEEGKDPGGGL